VIGAVSVFKVVAPQRVSIRDPELADIAKVGDTEVHIIGKKVGETSLTIWDQNGEHTYYIIIYPQEMERVKAKLKKLINKDLGISNVYYKDNETSGKVMILGEVTPVQKEQIDRVIATYYNDSGKSDLIDNLLTVKQESRMVEIDCQILELNKNDLDRIGFKWMEYMNVREEPYKAPSGTSGGVETTLNSIREWSALWEVAEGSRDALTVRMNFLVRNNKAKVLSRPKLLCLSGQESKLTVGGEVPYLSASTTNASGTTMDIQYKDYGVIVNLKPVVLEDKKILLNVSTEVSELDWANALTISGTKVPAFITREANTALNISSGDTIFLGGLIKNKEAKNVDKFPGLANLPVLGAVFRSKDFQNDQSELVITLTPVIRESKGESETLAEQQTAISGGPAKPVIYPEHLSKDNVLNDYILKVQNMIFRSLDYPRMAEEAGWQGTVKLKMHLKYDGELIDVRVSESSGYVSFDNNVVATSKSLSPYPPFPPSIELEDLWIDIPIVYKMGN
jgi:pilus assembly protein CpaC